MIVILALLIELGIPNAVSEPGEDNKRDKAVLLIMDIETALHLYWLYNGFCPTTEQGLEALVTMPTMEPQPKRYVEGGFMKRVPVDPWGNPFIYRNIGEKSLIGMWNMSNTRNMKNPFINRSPEDKGLVEIISCGPDGEEGTEDDITNHDEP